MAKVKFEGVIQAVRCLPGGEVDWVRAYLRRGPTFSDYVKLDRQDLIDQLKAGKRFYAGKRVPMMASTFEISKPVRVIHVNGREVLTTGDLTPDQDHLEGIPFI